MKDPAKEHVVVVGRGIAGAMTAWRFHKRGCDVRWWGDGSHAASRVAAGMYNPVSFRHVVEVWNAKHHVAAMKALLEDMQQSLGLEDSLFDDVPVMRIFPNDQSREDWDARIEEGHGVAQWIGRSQEPVGHVSAADGCGVVTGSGWVNVPAMLDAVEGHFQTLGKLEDRPWQVEMGLPDGATLLVDCRGVGASEELAQHGLKVSPNHGDVLTLSTPEGALNTEGHNVNNGKWLLPMGVKDGRRWWRLGATYSWHRMAPTPDPSAVGAIRGHMLRVFDDDAQRVFLDAQLEAHDAGLRPASPDRRPMVGPWPGQREGVAMLNGLGTRGVLVAPTASQRLVDWWLDGAAIPDEMRSDRFKGFQK